MGLGARTADHCLKSGLQPGPAESQPFQLEGWILKLSVGGIDLRRQLGTRERSRSVPFVIRLWRGTRAFHRSARSGSRPAGSRSGTPGAWPCFRASAPAPAETPTQPTASSGERRLWLGRKFTGDLGSYRGALRQRVLDPSLRFRSVHLELRGLQRRCHRELLGEPGGNGGLRNRQRRQLLEPAVVESLPGRHAELRDLAVDVELLLDLHGRRECFRDFGELLRVGGHVLRLFRHSPGYDHAAASIQCVWKLV